MNFRKLLAFLLTLVLIVGVIPFSFLTASAETVKMGYIYKTDVNIRKDASTSSEKVANVSKLNVKIIGSKTDVDNTKNPATDDIYVWHKVSYTSQSQTITGYVREDLIKVADVTPDPDFKETLKDFPESYHDDLMLLHAIYPKWKFEADEVPTTFAGAVAAQDSEYRKLVVGKSYNSWRSMRNKCYDWEKGTFITTDGGRYGASREVIAYYMDPRNFLNANEIFIYMQQSYDSATQTVDGVQKILDGTFLSGNVTDKNDKYYGKPYAGVIRKAASISGVNAYVLASTIIQEHGTKGTTLSKGTTYKGKTVYNFFNYGASGTTSSDVLNNGKKYAYNAGWFTPTEAIAGSINEGFIFETNVNIRKDATTKSDAVGKVSELNVNVLGSKNDAAGTKNPATNKTYVWYKISYILNSKTITGYVREDLIKFTEGGATKYGKNYIAIGQDTYFYKNYNVLNPDKIWHQYAQNVADSLSSSNGLRKTYAELYDMVLTFRIPVYKDLPTKVSKLPAKSDKLNNYYFENLTSDGLSPAYNRYTSKYTLNVSGDTELFYKLPEGATYTGESTYALTEGTNTVKLKIKSQTGYSRTYTVTVTAETASILYIKSNSTTLKKEEDGNWYYYIDGQKTVDTTLVKYSGKWFYVKDGVWTKDTTLFKYNGKWFYIENGKWNSNAETLVKYKDAWFYVKKGKWDNTAETLVKYNGIWFYVKNGKWSKDKLIFTYSGKQFYVNKGKVDLTFSGTVKVDGKTYKIKNGKVNSQ